jgi:hypothetical protein
MRAKPTYRPVRVNLEELDRITLPLLDLFEKKGMLLRVTAIRPISEV